MIEALKRMMVAHARALVVAGSAFALYLLLGFLAAPALVERGIRNYVAETLKRTVSLGEVRVNPLLFKVEIRDFALNERDGAPIVGFERLLVNFELSSLLRWAWTFSEIALEGLDLRVDIAPDGKLNLAALAESFPKGEGPPAEHPPRLLLQHVALKRGAVTLSDRSVPTPASATLRLLDLEMRDISTLPDRRGPHTMSARLPDGGSLSWRGEMSLQPVVSQGEVDLRSAKPGPIWRFLHEHFNLAEPAGEFDLGVRYRFSYSDGASQLTLTDARFSAREIALRSAEPGRTAQFAVGVAGVEAGFAAQVEARGARVQVLLRDLVLKLSRVTAGEAGAAEPIVSLGSIALAGGSLDLDQRRLAIQSVAVTDGKVNVVREKDGSLRPVEILRAAERGQPPREVAGRSRDAGTKAEPWSASLDAFDVSGVRVALADRSFEPAVAYGLEGIHVGLKNLRTEGKTPAEFEASLRVAQGGAVHASGNFDLDGSRAAARVKVERVTLKPLQPMVAHYATVRLESGEISTSARLEYRAGASRPQLRVTGSAALDNLLVNEDVSGERLLSLRSFAAEGIDFNLEPGRLHVVEARLLEPGAKIVIFKDRSLNLAQALRPQPETAPGAPGAAIAPGPEAPKPVAASAGGAEAPAAPFDIAVQRVRVEKGIVDFADLSLVLPFAAKVEEFQGTATGISSDPASGAAVKLEGRVGEFGLARVDGTVRPFQPKAHTDLAVVFRNVEMLPLSPYTATFAGRRIASGRLSLDLRYKIENSNLAGDNKVAMEKFTLGEQVDAPGALNLPYDLAIALLTDADGRIDVAVPVTGNVDDPQFSYGHLIWQAVATVIRNVVTYPFRALAQLFGGSGESPENIAFDAGRATLQPPEREKLNRVAQVLGKRPQLKLVVEGQFGEADRAALRERDVAAAIAAKLGRAPAAGAMPEPVNPLDARTQRAMEALFVERASEAAFARFVAEIEKARAKPVQRVNPVLALTGRASADTAFYQAVLKQLEDTARIADEAPVQLAGARARAVASYMTETQSVPSARVAAKAAEPGGERVKLSFEVAPQPGRASGPDTAVISGR
ncbi:MAG TPA: DUF748 domain-containing protein [Burkholderiales bacterium]|nr:DUF748 domain-containing protein [Burkholderiales bacterium]